ncbi:MAG: hypothetical protein AAGI69_12660 [Cyanobacteria bacterium P01_H01_bin.21]
MPQDTIPSVLDLKPMEYNPFMDGTVVYDEVGGTLAPVTVASPIQPLNSGATDYRPSRASTEALRDAARSSTRTGVGLDDVSLRGYRNVWGGLDTKRFGAAVDSLSDSDLNDFIDDVAADLAASGRNAQAMIPRANAMQMLKRGSQALNVLGTAVDAWNLGSALIDPTNNPLDEIGDIAGSAIGGTLGAPLGPVGALAGSLIGGFIGRQLGNLLQGDGARGTSLYAEPLPFEGGQCAIDYRFDKTMTYKDRYGQVKTVNRDDIATGPIGAPFQDGASVRLRVQGNRSVPIFGSPTEGEILSFSISNVRPRDSAFLDDCGNGFKDPEETPTAPSYPRVDSPTNNPFSNPGIDDPVGNPGSEPEPLPDVDADEDDTSPNPEGRNKYDDPPSLDDLPEDPPDRDGNPREPVDPNSPEGKCCPETIAKLNEIIEKLSWTYQGVVDMTACDGEGESVEWQGDGLDGIYEAVKILQEQTQIIHENTKCPPESNAALPMAWDVKVHEHPQLIVLWGPAEGGSSRWAMHIPHPRANIDDSYTFKFPQYKKGPVMGKLVLKDNTRIVVNGASEGECKKVFSYARKLVDKNAIEGATEIYTKGGSKLSIVTVKAVYVKAFAGHRSETPLWAKRL